MRVSDRGLLREPQLHDGYLTAVRIEDAGHVVVRLRDYSKTDYTLTLSGIESFCCNNFREGNIICHVLWFSGIQPDVSLLRSIVGEPHPSVGSPHREHHERLIQRYSDDVAEGRLTLIAIEPSYGCELYALCGTAELQATSQL